VSGAVTEATKQKLVDQVGSENLARWKELGIDIGLATEAMAGNKDASDANAAAVLGLTATALEADSRFQKMGDTLTKAGVSSEEFAAALLNGNLDAINEKLAAVGVTADVAANGAITLTDSAHKLVGSIDAATGKSGELTTAYHLINGEAGLLSGAQQALATDNEALAGSADDAAGATDDQGKSTADAIVPAEELSKAVQEQDQANKDLETSVRNAIKALDDMQHRNDPQSAMDAAGATRDYAAALRDQEKAQRDSAIAGDAVTEAQIKVDEINAKVIDSTYSQTQKDIDLRAAQNDLADASAGVQDAFDKVSDSSNDVYKSGQDVRDSYIEQAREAAINAAATGGLAGAHAAAKAKVDELTKGLYNQLIQSGYTDEQAQAYITTLGLVPDEVATAVTLTNLEATKVAIAGLKLSIDQIPNSKDIQINVNGKYNAVASGVVNTLGLGFLLKGKAEGGRISGPGGPTDDQVPIMASSGEHMWTAAETRAAGGHAAVEGLRHAALSGTLGRRGFASGGAVMASALSMPVSRVTVAADASPSMSASQANALGAKLDRLSTAIVQLAQTPRSVMLAGGDVNVVEAAGGESLDSKLFRLAGAVLR
jgi:hypothetical protein